jgi:aromatic ring-opening dioxygenase catalytic subunit (LigB family)
MLLINPVANIPIVQLSVLSSESPNEHYLMGRALSSLRDSNIAIVGSGFASLHNLRVMFSGALSESAFKTRNKAFSAKVAEAVGEIDVEERGEKFESWREWPSSYEMHPKGGAEHFMPLIVCAGAGGEGEAGKWKDEFMGVDFWSFYWE